MADYNAKISIYINAQGDGEVDAQGHLVEDSTIASRVTVRLRARRGEYYRDRTFGSRLHELRTLEQAQAGFLPACEEALKPLVDAGEILRLEQGAFETRPSGMVAAELLVYVTEEEVLRIAGLPLGSGR